MDDIRLRAGVAAETAIAVLGHLVSEAKNVQAAGGGLVERVLAYTQWVETAERQLSAIFSASAVWQELHTDRYWYLRDVGRNDMRPAPLVTDEAKWQSNRLERLRESMQRLSDALSVPDGCVSIVPDTNVLVHYLQFDQIKWKDIVGGQVRLIIPSVVLDELDDLSYRSLDTSDRARSVLKALRSLWPGPASPVAPAKVRAGVEVQLFADDNADDRIGNRDSELLKRAELLGAFLGDSLRIATGDLSMQLRAAIRGLNAFEMPSSLRLPPTKP